MTAFEAYEHYKAIKLHFQSEKYDYFVYNGKVRGSTFEAFERRNDRYFFEYLTAPSNNLITDVRDLIEKMVIYYHLNRSLYIKEFISWCKNIKNDEYYWKFYDLDKNPLIIINKDLEQLHLLKGIQKPSLFFFNAYISKTILIETFLLLSKVLPLFEDMQKEYNPLFISEIEFIKKYIPFSKIKSKAIRSNIKEILQNIKEQVVCS